MKWAFRLYDLDGSGKVEKEELKAIKEINKNSKAFWRYANRKRKAKESIGPLRCGKGETYTSDEKRMAEILSQQYTSVFSEPLNHSNLSNLKLPKVQLDGIIFSKEDIQSAMVDIKYG